LNLAADHAREKPRPGAARPRTHTGAVGA
jgi:hypothetical protein